MRYYKIIKYCRACNKKFFAESSKSYSQYYCEDCFKKYNNSNKDE